MYFSVCIAISDVVRISFLSTRYFLPGKEVRTISDSALRIEIILKFL